MMAHTSLVTDWPQYCILASLSSHITPIPFELVERQLWLQPVALIRKIMIMGQWSDNLIKHSTTLMYRTNLLTKSWDPDVLVSNYIF